MIIIQLDLGYLAISYPDISIIRLQSCSVYWLFFIHFPHKIFPQSKNFGWYSQKVTNFSEWLTLEF